MVQTYSSLQTGVPQTRPARPRSSRLETSAPFIFLLLLLHVPLALLMQQSADVATWHAVLVGGLAIFGGLFARRPQVPAYACAYTLGAEVLWRMTDAQVFWEWGKYIVVAALGLAVLRFARSSRGPLLATLYVLLLLPSAWLTIEFLGFSDRARDAISFNLSGPLALAVSVAFFASNRFTWDEIQKIMWWAVLPMVSIASIAFYSTLTSAQSIEFTEDSNFITSGGFGPNQVAAILGLGALLCIFLAAHKSSTGLRITAALLAIWFLGQSALTLSRGGLVAAGVALLVGATHYVKRPRQQVGLMAAILLVFFAFGYLVLPQLNAFTGDILRKRFSDVDTTGRLEIAQADLELWESEPLLGVGAGMSSYYRSSVLVAGSAAHTEFTRLPAEHGAAGLLAILFLGVMVWRAYKQAPTVAVRIWSISLASWALVDMSHSAMRIVAVSFIFGLMTARVKPVTWRAEPKNVGYLEAPPPRSNLRHATSLESLR